MTDEIIESGAEGLSEEEAAAFEAMQRGEEPETEDEPETEGDTEEQDEGSEEEKAAGKQKVVPHGALHQERERRKQAEQELLQLRERTARLEERWNLFLQHAQGDQKAAQPEAPPDPDQDIFGYARWLAEQNKDLREKVEQTVQQTQQQAVAQRIAAAARADAQRFVQERPDFQDAYRYLYETRAAEYRALGYPEQHIRFAMEQEELQTAAMALQGNRSPAEIFYQLALARGYRPKEGGADPNGGNPAAAKLERVASGQKANRSLSSAGGGAADGSLSIEELLKMDEDEYAKFLEKYPKKARALLGG